MAIPTVNQLAQTLMREAGEAVSNTDLISQYEDWIQTVFDDIGIETKWRYLWNIGTINTVSSQRLYALSGTLDQEIAARFTVDNTPLRLMRRQEMMGGVDLELTGTPTDFYIETYNPTTEEFSIGLYPIPTSIIAIEFLGVLNPQELTSGTKLPMPRRFISTLKHGVNALRKEDDKNYNGATLAKARFERGLRMLKISDSNLSGHFPQMQIQDIPHSDTPFVRLPPNHFRN